MKTDLNDMDLDSDEFIFKLFRGRCVVCHGKATEINEIIPRSRGRDSMFWKNRVTMCRSDHEAYHNNGVSATAIQNLQQIRVSFLISMGREEWI